MRNGSGKEGKRGRGDCGVATGRRGGSPFKRRLIAGRGRIFNSQKRKRGQNEFDLSRNAQECFPVFFSLKNLSYLNLNWCFKSGTEGIELIRSIFFWWEFERRRCFRLELKKLESTASRLGTVSQIRNADKNVIMSLDTSAGIQEVGFG